MNFWQWLLRLEAVLVALMVAGCGTAAPAVRVESGARGETFLFIPRSATVDPVEVPPEEVTQSLQRMARQVRLSGSPRETVERLLQLDVLYGDYLYLLRERKFVPLEGGTPLEGALTQQEQQWVSWYTDWCRSEHRFNGDCLGGALVAGKYMDLRGRYMWAMALSKSPVLEEFEKALGHMVTMRAVLQAAMCTVVTLMVLLAMPDPVTKFIAAWATVKDFAQQIGTLPGSAQVSVQAEAQGGLLLSEVATVESVAVTADGFTVALGPGAVAMAANGGRGGRTQKHHIGTIANKKSSMRGGPWTPLFEKLFARAGMSLKDAENVVPIQGHRGPHPQRYHELIYKRLQGALGNCRSISECREYLTRELRDLAEEISTPGTELNQLVTLGH